MPDIIEPGGGSSGGVPYRVQEVEHIVEREPYVAWAYRSGMRPPDDGEGRDGDVYIQSDVSLRKLGVTVFRRLDGRYQAVSR